MINGTPQSWNEKIVTCETCRHFDKAAHPKNKEYGVCRVAKPLLPIWVLQDISVLNRSVARTTQGCPLHDDEPYRKVDPNGHKPVLMKVWTKVDKGIAEDVRNLSEMIGVLTHSSCEGDFGVGAYVSVTWDDDDARARIAAEYDLSQEGDHWAYAHPRKSK